MQKTLLSLDDVKADFEHWRSIRTKQRERIPQYLWDKVKTLIDRYSLTEITSALRINTGQIKDNLKINRTIHFNLLLCPFQRKMLVQSSCIVQMVSF